MDRIKKYQNIIHQIMQETHAMMSKTGKRVEDIIVLDDERGHYLLYTDRWRDRHSRIYGCYLHIDLAEDGKVWLKYDGTDLEIGQQLLDAGVAGKDLVLAWISPSRRADTGYAVA
ncbi:MAG: element excision factor XisI family protein [Bacteroidota bacterium]